MLSRKADLRYTYIRESTIIYQTIHQTIIMWEKNRTVIILVLLVIAFIAYFSFSDRTPAGETIMDLAVQNETIEDEGILEDELQVSELDYPDMETLIIENNEIF